MRKPDTELIKSKSIRDQWVVRVMEHSGSKVNLVILDACRTFPRPDIPRATSEDYGLSAMNAPKGTIISFATGSGKTASDGKRGNGLYTGYLLKFMRQAGLSIEEVFKKTRQQVAMETANRQVHPVYSTTRLCEVQNLEAVIDTILCLIWSYHFQSRTDSLIKFISGRYNSFLEKILQFRPN